MKNKNLVFLVIFLLLNLIPHLYVSFSKPDIILNWYLTDDAFYYFKTAQNIAEGNGITFDGIAPTNGFHPLWMLVCIPVFVLARVDLYLPLRLLILIQGLLNAISGYLLFRILADKISGEIGLLAAFFWMFLPQIHAITTKLGLESSINAVSIFYLILSISKFTKTEGGKKLDLKSIFFIGLAGIISIFSRLDNVFIVMIIGIWLVLHDNQIRHHALQDFFLIIVSSLVSYFLRIQTTGNILNFLPFAYILVIASLVVKPVLLFFLDEYGNFEKKKIKNVIFQSVIALTLASIIVGFSVYLLFDVFHFFRGYSRLVMVIDYLISIIFLVGIRIYRWKKCQRLGCEDSDTNLKRNWRIWVSRAIVYYAPLGFSLASYMYINKQYAGSAMPVSGKIKHWWGTLPNTVYGQPLKSLQQVISSFFDPSLESGPLWLISHPINSIALNILRIFRLPAASSQSIVLFLSAILWISIFAIVIMIFYKFRGQFVRLLDQLAIPALALGCFVQILSYTASGYLHAKYWYWIAEMILIVLLASIFIGLVFKDYTKRNKKTKATIRILYLLMGIPLILFGYGILRDFPIDGDVASMYDVKSEVEFIKSESQPEDVIGMTGGGVLGYFIPDRIFVNLDGLINSAEYFEMMKSDKSDQYLKKINMQYIYGEESVLLDSDPYRWMFYGRIKFLDKGPIFWLYQYCGGQCIP